MAQEPVIGKNVALLLGDPVDVGTPVYKQLVCATTMTLNRTNNISKTETKCGVIKTPGTHDYNITFSGVQMNQVDAGNMSEGDVHTLFKDDKLQAFKIGPMTPTGGETIYEGEGYITTENSTWPATGESTYEVTIEVVGEVDKSTAPTP